MRIVHQLHLLIVMANNLLLLHLLIVMANILRQHHHYIFITLKASMEKVMNLKPVRTLHVSNVHLHHHFKYPKLDQLSSAKMSQTNVFSGLLVLSFLL
ncbi:hypothetical protein DAPPUDRAFT_266529 [Daphnia pulex]|uniref:Uncharacterized protein n=1 Tax=Daphnia pulex TaxID=6669 RepID=E9HV61_DAPPU|nr:hypothetical protein DAPPUDRAFT_266529 [Daphnia pulex]|eukprot:EFX64372.1 hypothetical protein DAPPUDRAFT_266529 [Daphnia pulex]